MRLPDKTLAKMFHLPEREQIERKESLNDSDKICYAICAFANDRFSVFSGMASLYDLAMIEVATFFKHTLMSRYASSGLEAASN